MPSSPTHPLETLRAAIPPVTDGVEGVVAQTGVISGTAFFPGGWGLWCTQEGQDMPAMPIGGIMIVGQDFDSERGFEASRLHRSELGLRSDGTYRSPTWRELVRLLTDVGVDLKECFFTNAYMGLRAGAKNTGRFPGASNKRYQESCRAFFLQQVAAMKPRLIITLGNWVPAFIAPLAAELDSWKASRTFTDIDQAGSLREGVVFSQETPACSVIALTHPRFRQLNVHRRSYAGHDGKLAEEQLLRDALQR